MSRRSATISSASALGLLLTLFASVDAATIYGTIREGGRPVANLRVELGCATRVEPPSQTTDTRGTYRFNTGRTGRCELRVQGAEDTSVIFYDEPTRYDFEIRQEAGRRRLIRQ